MSVRVKICGVNSQAAMDAAAAADWVGFVFHPASPRYVTPAQAATFCASYVDGPARIGLFVNPGDDDIAAALDRVTLQALQLYAPPARIAAIHARFGVAVWRAVAVAGPADLQETAEIAAALIIEPPPPPGATRPGGLAQQLDWRLLAGWRPAIPWLLAGGLTPDNVARAIAVSGARAVDVSSGVESAPGVKDPARIASFIAAVRAHP